MLVAGLGRAGQAAVDALAGSAGLAAWDASDTRELRGVARRLRRRGVDVTLGGDGRRALERAGAQETVVKSPGIPLTHPLIQAAEGEVIDELELGWRRTAAPMVGVTGTNGKSTTSQLCCAVLGGAGHQVELVGNTEFGPPLSGAGGEGWVVCEVSSFQLEAAPSVRPDVAVFTNLTPDHLDRHGSMERYGAAKRSLFVRDGSTAGVSVVNVDDPFGGELVEAVRAAGGEVIGYGRGDSADVRVLDASWSVTEAEVSLRAPGGRVSCPTRLPGAHNVHNVAAAFAAGVALGLPADTIAAALGKAAPPPGRWQLVDEGQAFSVMVDYAHTPDGLRGLLEAVRQGIGTEARVLTVFGPVGVHDRAKDRDSGRVVGRLSDRVVVTTGSAGVPGRLARIADVREAAGRAEVVLDRRAAIARAVEGARPGDAVVLAGLGHLRRQLLDGYTRWAHNDADAARAVLRSGAPAWS